MATVKYLENGFLEILLFFAFFFSPHAPSEKQKHDAGIGSGKICKGGSLISSLKWLGNFHMTSFKLVQ
jgi:hypothetical protein